MSSYTMDQIYQQVSQQVASEMAAASAPIERALGQVGQDEQNALASIGNLFGGLQPRVEEGTRFVGQSYDQAIQNERNIYEAANARLAGMREARAADAQKMAQMIGGPVAIGDFTAGVEPAQQYYAQTGAGQLLHSLALAESGKQEAAAFSGKVFPLLRTEAEMDTRRQFSKRRSELEGQLADLRNQKTSVMNERLFQRQTQEKEFELKRVDQQLDRLKSDRDWKATLRSLKNDEARIALARAESKRAESVLSGKWKGKDTLEATQTKAQIAQAKRDAALRNKEITASIKNQTAQQKLEAARLGLSARELAVREWDIKNQGKLRAQESQQTQRRLAMELVDAALSGGQGKPIKQTVTTEVDRQTAVLNKKAYGIPGPDGQVHYFLDRTVEVPGAAIPRMQDPQKLYELLMGYGITSKMAENIVESRLSTPTFQPGKTSYSAAEMQSMPFSQLRGVAIKLGFVPRGKATRAKLINFINRRS